MRIRLLYGATFSEDWGRSQNLARALAGLGHDIDYIDCIRPLGTSSKRPVHPHPGINWFRSAPGLSDRPGLASLNAILQAAWLTPILREPVDLTIFYGIPHPFVQRVAIRLSKGSRISYDCADDKYSTFLDLIGPKAASRVREWERLLVGQVDSLTAINDSNLLRLDPERKLSGGVVPNGVDSDLFRFRRRVVPANRRLRLAYAGTVNDRLDTPRLRQILEVNPGVELHIFGGDHEALDCLRGHPRLFIRGRIPYRSLPQVLDSCDIGLVPYRDLPSIRASSPLKSLQYLALGMPVLAFEYPGLPTFDGSVRILEGTTIPVQARGWVVEDDHLAKTHSWTESARSLLRQVAP
ncbi:MAG: hypothetical protein RL173_2511 [Fibrobacterota bacterium]|jgi:glycosyltransferase involved in cell wall biosynthesis